MLQSTPQTRRKQRCERRCVEFAIRKQIADTSGQDEQKRWEIKTLFGLELDAKAQRAIWDALGQKHGLAPGEYFDLTKGSTHTQRGRRRAEAEAWVLENAAKRGITVWELLRNLVTAQSKMDAADEE